MDLQKRGAQITSRLNSFEWVTLFFIRFSLAAVFIESGWGKLHNLAKVSSYFESLGLPMAHLQAPFVAGSEFVCGCLVLVGLATRLAAIPIIIMMIVATALARWSDLQGWTDLFGFIEVLYVLLALVLLTRGPGCFSIDAWLTRRRKDHA